jgi:putative membrane-bound dehydrogenase-like protein
MYVPIKEGEDKPAGPPQVLLDGWHYEDTHETLNAFMWGPDGWLYGCHGVFTHSRVGKPGTPDDQRIPINAGVWRYHPTKHIFEVFAHGTSNPWGLDFDEHGQMFIEACVVPHAFHIVQGGRYDRQAGEHFNKHTYADIKTIADHLHWQGQDQWKANNRSDAVGGGHAHCGLMIYQGGAWPQEFCKNLIIGNVHGHRFNMDILKPKGSSFIASHGPDFIHANDAWARFINIKSGPDGNAYFLDWYDKQACHTGDVNIWDRSNGRIYKISYRGTKPVTRIDLAKLSDKDLVELQTHKNDWYVRHARRLLQERAARKMLEPQTSGALARVAFRAPDSTHRLHALWALHAIGTLNLIQITEAVNDKDPYIRAWAIQFAAESKDAPQQTVFTFLNMANSDPSPVVRLYLASALQRMPQDLLASNILAALLHHAEDSNDPNLPLMYWYAAEPFADVYTSRALELAVEAKIPILLPFMVRRVASAATPEAMALVVKTLAKEGDTSRQLAILRAINEALKGHRQVPMPAAWSELSASLTHSKDAGIRARATALAVTFGDPKAFAELRRVVAARDADLASRQSALAALLGARDKELAAILLKLIDDKPLRSAAIRGLAIYDEPQTPAVLVGAYPTLTAEEKRDALTTLASRPAFGKALMEAVAVKSLPASDVPAEIVRQLRILNDKTLDARIAEVWGIVRATPADRLKLIADWKKKLNAQVQPPDLPLGRAIFAKTCQQCHTLYGVGGKVGPDITGSNRGNLDYLLENILDPSAVIPNEYKATVFALKNGRVVTGIVRGETPAAFTVVTQNETLTLPRDEIDEHKISDVSMMPDDILRTVNETEFRALVAYLRSPNQTPILATPDNAKDLFNGKDLTGWDGDPKLWSVENGEIVGKSTGIKKNEFLKSHMVATDFRLTLKVKLVPNKENSGVQFRSDPLPDGEMKGPQADIGQGWWGKLYEENGRGVIHNNQGEKYVKPDQWNDYEIIAQGSHIKTLINGQVCVDLDDSLVSRRGIFALQIHSGGPMEVRFKDVRLEVLAASAKP